MRTSGLVDRPTAVAAGDHVCWLFDDDHAFRAAAVEFLREGRDRNERLLYVADRPGGDELERDLAPLGDVGRLVRDGALEVVDARELYERNGAVAPEQQVAHYDALTRAAIDDGYAGLRVAADVTALARVPEARREMVRYEFAVDRLMSEQPMTALCAYDARALGSAATELTVVHPRRHLATATDPGFCLYHSGGRLRLAGEVDIASHACFAAALDAATAAGNDLVLDLEELEFIDTAGLSALGELVSSLAGRGRTVRLTGAQPVVRRCAAILDLEPLALAGLLDGAA